MYLIQIERLERIISTYQIIVGFRQAMGDEKAEMPDLEAARAQFDEWLISAPDEVNADPEVRERRETLAAMGFDI